MVHLYLETKCHVLILKTFDSSLFFSSASVNGKFAFLVWSEIVLELYYIYFYNSVGMKVMEKFRKT